MGRWGRRKLRRRWLKQGTAEGSKKSESFLSKGPVVSYVPDCCLRAIGNKKDTSNGYSKKSIEERTKKGVSLGEPRPSGASKNLREAWRVNRRCDVRKVPLRPRAGKVSQCHVCLTPLSRETLKCGF